MLNLQLLHDVKTQWDSTFYMLNRIHAVQPAVNLFVALPSQQKDLAKHKLSDAEWSVLWDYETILNVLHKVQQQMSAEVQPTLGHAIPAFELFMTTWEKMQQSNPCMAPFIDAGL
ncbi:hypothetical protein BKA83DRAFT_4058373 [Pisolithus microcarpus]|nr:hypothetical protein BKA83DRAFT_4058373 [Pisolithus microcarpus]